MDKSSNVKERILQLADIKGITKESFFKDLGLTYGNFKGKSKETPINSNALADILTKYPDVDPNWLILGAGSMFRNVNYEELASHSSIAKRLLEFIKHENLTFREFEVNSGVSELKINTMLMGNGFLTPAERQNIAFAFPQLNQTWLSFGREGMIKSEEETKELEQYLQKYNDESVQIVKTLFATEFRKLQGERYLIICPYVAKSELHSFYKLWWDVHYLESLPKHPIAAESLILSGHISFSLGFAKGGLIGKNDVITVRKIDPVNLRTKLTERYDDLYLLHYPGDLILVRITEYSFQENTIRYLDVIKDDPEANIEVSIANIEEIYKVVEIARPLR